MSEDNRPSLISKTLENGAARYIVKPFFAEDFKDIWKYAMEAKKEKLFIESLLVRSEEEEKSSEPKNKKKHCKRKSKECHKSFDFASFLGCIEHNLFAQHLQQHYLVGNQCQYGQIHHKLHKEVIHGQV